MTSHLKTILENKYLEMIATNHLHSKLMGAKRFATGLSHYVFEVETEVRDTFVVRIATPERRLELEDGLYWQAKLEKIGISLPKIYHWGEIQGYSFAIYERIPGTDLEEIYPALSSKVRQTIAYSVADIQKKTQTLEDPRFNNALHWSDTIEIILNRSEREILKTGLYEKRYVDLTRNRLNKYQDYLSSLKPVPFLYDTSVRNVIILNNTVSGIVDVDEVWFGDPLLAIGRGKSLLLLMQRTLDFIFYWCEYLNLSSFQMKMIDLYALLYCIRFMGTSGQKLNGNPSVQTKTDHTQLVMEVTHNLLEVLK